MHAEVITHVGLVRKTMKMLHGAILINKFLLLPTVWGATWQER